MQRPQAFALLVFLGLLLAGCVEPAPPAAIRTPSPSATVAAGEGGECLRGVVLTDELLPVAHATVALLPLNLQATTGEDGRFEFCGLEAGRLQVTVGRLGFKPWGRAVDLPLADDELRVILEPLPILEPYLLVVPKTVHYTFGISTLDTTTSRFGVNPNTCNPCTFSIVLEHMPDHVLWEATWQRNPTPPSPAADRMYHIFRGGAPFEAGSDIGTGTMGKPWVRNYTRDDLQKNEHVKNAKQGVPVSGSMYCSGEPLWPCMDQRIQVYLTFFYDYEALPDVYSALPPG